VRALGNGLLCARQRGGQQLLCRGETVSEAQRSTCATCERRSRGLTLPLGEKLSFSLTYSREQRDGNKNTTFYGGPSYEVATPIAFRTHNVLAAAEFSDGRWFGNASVNFSKFQNEVPYAEIDNPERLEMVNPASGSRTVYNDAATFRLWLPPDNKAYSIDLSGGVKLPRRHKVTATFSSGNMSMDTPLLPISTNPNLAAGTAASPFTVGFPNNDSPFSSVSAEYDTLMGSVKVTGDPVSKFGYSLSFRRYELKDKTQAYTFKSSARGDVGGSYSTTGFTREHEGYSTQSVRARCMPSRSRSASRPELRDGRARVRPA